MLRNPKVTKEDIIDASIKIIKEEGLDNLNVRNIANTLGCSIQPIYYQFGSFDELKKVVFKHIGQIYADYMHHEAEGISQYKQMGLNYIRFAKEQPKLFQLLLMTKTNLSPQEFIAADQNFDEIMVNVGKATNLDNDVNKLTTYHMRMWTFTHGLACLIATGTCVFTEEEISMLLTDEYQALNLLEEKRRKERKTENE